MGRGGLCPGAPGKQTDLPEHRLLHLPLVPRHGARILRERAVAAFLNAHFVSIKVDREERPDVDKIYMTTVQAMTGQGGWPLNCFLTPDLKPFYGGTYFPPDSKYGQPGFASSCGRSPNSGRRSRARCWIRRRIFTAAWQSFAAPRPGGLALSPGLPAHDAAASSSGI